MRSPEDCLEEAIWRLLHDQNARKAFLQGRTDLLGLPEDVLEELSTIDGRELDSTAERICLDLLRGNAGPCGGLRAAFPKTLALLSDAGHLPLEIMSRFVASEDFISYRDLPFAGPGVSVEEAFHSFLSHHAFLFDRVTHGRSLAMHEFLYAALSSLVVDNEPHYELRSPFIQDNGIIRFATMTYDRPAAEQFVEADVIEPIKGDVTVLYAAARSGFVFGPVELLAADLVSVGREHYLTPLANAIAKKHSTTALDVFSTFEGLRQWGVVI